MRPSGVELADGGPVFSVNVPPGRQGAEPDGTPRRVSGQNFRQKGSQGTGPLALGAQSRGLLDDQRWILATSLFSQLVQSDQLLLLPLRTRKETSW